MLSVCSLTCGVGAEDEVGFSVNGVLECKFFRAGGDIFKTQALEFKIRVTGKRWQLTNFEGATNRWLRGSDGAAVYHVFQQQSAKPVEAGIVEFGPMPSGGYPSAVVWLAYASGGYLDDTSTMFGPWSDPFGEPSVTACDLQLVASKELPHVPESVQFVVSQTRINNYRRSNYFLREGVSALIRQEAEKRSAFDPPGFVSARYRVLQFTNCAGNYIPLEFELLKYRPTGEAGHPNSPLAAAYHGYLRSCQSATNLEFAPDIMRKPVSVSDLRFRDVSRPLDSIHYTVTNNWIASTNDAMLLAIKASKISSLPRFSPQDWRRYAILAVLCLFALLIIVFSGMKLRTRPKSSEQGVGDVR